MGDTPIRARGRIFSQVATGLIAVLMAAGSLRAQDGVTGGTPAFSPPQDRDNTPTTGSQGKIIVQSNLVTTPVVVKDAAGNFVYNLEPTDFQVFDNDVPQKIVKFETEMTPLAVVILVQTSDSVEPVLKNVKPLAPIFSGLMLGDKGHAAVIFFDDRVRRVQPFSNDGAVLDKTFQSIEPGDAGARLNDALAQAVNMLIERPKPERRIIVALASGFDSGSETSRAEVVRRATAGEVEIYGLGLSTTKALLTRPPEGPQEAPGTQTAPVGPTPPGMPSTPDLSHRIYDNPVPVGSIANDTGQLLETVLRRNPLEYYSRFTGGAYFAQWSAKVLQGNLNQIATDIASQYELAYVPDDLKQVGFHRIVIRVLVPGAKVRARAGYFYMGKAK